MTECYKSAGSSQFGAVVNRGGSLAATVRPSNHYVSECHAPLAVADVDKLHYGCDLYGIDRPKFLVPGVVSQKWHDSVLLPLLNRIGKADRIEFERLLSGGGLRWQDEFCNLVVNTGLDDILGKYWKGSAYTAAHYVGLTSATPTVAAGDTMGSHAWTEIQDYDEPTRPALTLGSVTAQSVNNSASKATFTANAGATVGGAFITTDNTIGGTLGTLITVGAFTGGNRSLLAADTLSITATLTLADDGV